MRGAALAALVALAGLAACAGDPARQGDLATLRAVGGALGTAVSGGAAPSPAAASPDAVARVLAALPPGPVLRVTLPRTGQSAFAVLAAEAGATRTFATATGQTITLRGGMVIATRGFSGDLMSADTGGAEALLAARTGGKARRVWRVLDASDDEAPVAGACTIARQGEAPITLVTGARIKAARLRETCEIGGATVENLYWVTAAGTVRRSRQWAGPGLGEMRIEAVWD